MTQIKVTIVIPVYNVAKYLRAALRSIVNQTLQDIEIICINDGSTDESLEILNEFAQNDSRFIIINKENEGSGVARNIGISKAKGKYIAFFDADDIIKPEMYETMYNQAEELNSDIVICDYAKCNEINYTVSKPCMFVKLKDIGCFETVFVEPKQNIDKQIIYNNLLISPCYIWNQFYKADFIKKNKIAFSDLKVYQDTIFNLKAQILAQNVSYINNCLYFYRCRMDSTSAVASEYIYFNSLKEIEDFINKFPDIPVLKRNLINARIMTVYYILKEHMPVDKERKRLINQMREMLSDEDFQKFIEKIKTIYQQ